MEKEALISKDIATDAPPAVIVTGTQNTRIKQAPIKVPSTDRKPEKDALSVPNEATPKPSVSAPAHCKTETKSNIPWYLQD